MIDSFRGKYNFLSNFFSASVEFDGLFYKNNEAAFQAQKTLNRTEKEPFQYMDSPNAKRYGRKVKLRSDWEQVKDDIMYKICKSKFEQNPALKDMLLSTGDEELVEGNTWNDYYWGICKGRGQNKLGKILMKVREELR